MEDIIEAVVGEIDDEHDVAEWPNRESQISHRPDIGILTEAEPGFAISLGIGDLQRLFQMLARLREIALQEESRS